MNINDKNEHFSVKPPETTSKEKQEEPKKEEKSLWHTLELTDTHRCLAAYSHLTSAMPVILMYGIMAPQMS